MIGKHLASKSMSSESMSSKIQKFRQKLDYTRRERSIMMKTSRELTKKINTLDEYIKNMVPSVKSGRRKKSAEEVKLIKDLKLLKSERKELNSDILSFKRLEVSLESRIRNKGIDLSWYGH